MIFLYILEIFLGSGKRTESRCRMVTREISLCTINQHLCTGPGLSHRLAVICVYKEVYASAKTCNNEQSDQGKCWIHKTVPAAWCSSDDRLRSCNIVGRRGQRAAAKTQRRAGNTTFTITQRDPKRCTTRKHSQDNRIFAA